MNYTFNMEIYACTFVCMPVHQTITMYIYLTTLLEYLTACSIIV